MGRIKSSKKKAYPTLRDKQEKVQFVAFLAYAGDAILEIPLGANFEVSKANQGEELRKLIGFADRPRLLNEDDLNRVYMSNNRKFYVISASETFSLDKILVDRWEGKFGRWHEKIRKELEDKLSLLRLCCQNSIHVAFTYAFFNPEGIHEPLVRMGEWHDTCHPVMKGIRNDQIKLFEQAVTKFEFPFKDEKMQLAHEFFEAALFTVDPRLSFVSLMTALEVLFNPADRRELSYRIRRRTAVLLGCEGRKSLKIQKDIEKLYDKRSDVVHGGKGVIEENDVKTLRDYVRQAIMTIAYYRENIEGLGKILDEAAFDSMLLGEPVPRL